jgi:hypothetical protein
MDVERLDKVRDVIIGFDRAFGDGMMSREVLEG